MEMNAMAAPLLSMELDVEGISHSHVALCCKDGIWSNYINAVRSSCILCYHAFSPCDHSVR